MNKYQEYKTTVNKKSSEPALAVGTTTGTVAGILAIVVYLFPHLLSDHLTTVILIVSAFALPIITAIFTRGKVWSPASVKELLDEAIAEALRIERGTYKD